MNLLEVAYKYSGGNFDLQMTIAKEILHYDILSVLYSSSINKILVFQGGTALRLCHQNNRYSEDLDFALVNGTKFELNDMSFFKKSFEKKIQNKYGLSIEFTEPKNDENRVKKYTAKVLLPLANNQKAKINIEIAQIPSYDNSLKTIINNYPNEFSANTFVRVESKEEILADKIIALGTREYLKYRDFWDIKFLQDIHIKLNYDFVRQKIKDYEIENFYEKFAQKLSFIEQNDLRADFEYEMSRFLTPQLFEFARDNVFYNEVKKSVLEVGKEFLEYNTQEPQSAADKIRSMPKPTPEERQKARAFLDAAKQAHNADKAQESAQSQSKPKIRRMK